MWRDMEFNHLSENIRNNYWVTTASKKVVSMAGESFGNKIADAVTTSNDHEIVKIDENLRNNKVFKSKNNYSTRKKTWNIKRTDKSIIKMEHYKINLNY